MPIFTTVAGVAAFCTKCFAAMAVCSCLSQPVPGDAVAETDLRCPHYALNQGYAGPGRGHGGHTPEPGADEMHGEPITVSASTSLAFSPLIDVKYVRNST